MEIDFGDIKYLQHGSSRQQKAFVTLTNHQVLSKLKDFDPVLVGTIPINIDIESSDLDIICCYSYPEEFIEALNDHFKDEKGFTIWKLSHVHPPAIAANFLIDDFEIEIFGQSIPTRQQLAYRHLIVEYRLLNKHGEQLKKEILELKRLGLKTEPAFASALGLTGDPYIELLKFEHIT